MRRRDVLLAAAPLLAAEKLWAVAGEFSSPQIVVRRGSTVVCEGDSLTYGVDRTEQGVPAEEGVHKSNAPQSRTPYPRALKNLLGRDIQMVNRGVPGDRVSDGIRRWLHAPVGALHIILYGTNDGKPRSATDKSVVPVETYQELLGSFVRSRLEKKAQVILVSPPPVANRSLDVALQPYREAARTLALMSSVQFLDASQVFQATAADLYNDGMHFSEAGNIKLANSLARMIKVVE